MADIRYVCLSDLHLGAQNSILSKLSPDSVDVDLREPSAVMTGLLDCLATLISSNRGSQRPTLILNGDILEFALAEQNVAAMSFELFAEWAFGKHDGLFDDTVFFVPGNHDHHLWESARERQYQDYVASCPSGEALRGPWHTTSMQIAAEPQPPYSEFLGALFHRQLLGREVGVRIFYPNLALSDGGDSRMVIFSHGHFTERLYMLVSELEDMLFPARREGEVRNHTSEWEADNFAWIDFLGSTLGRSGQAGETLRLIYTSLESREIVNSLAGNLARGFTARTPGPPWLHSAEAPILARALGPAIRRATKFERTATAAPLSEDARAGLQTYLEQPVHAQIEREFDTVPRDVTFVFGHTHKPFADKSYLTGYQSPVRLYNTGGWAVDNLEPQPRQGGAAILLDEELNAVSLRLYDDASEGSSHQVYVQQADPEASNPLFAKVSNLVESDRQPWSGFSKSEADMAQQRRRDLAGIMDIALRDAKRKPKRWATGVGRRPT